MGEYADMIIDGETCQECGVYLGEAVGYPRSCRSCNSHSGLNNFDSVKNRRQPGEPREKVTCSVCKKRVNKVGIKDHMRVLHNPEPKKVKNGNQTG